MTASTPSPESAARHALSLSGERLSLMRRVMVSKWQSRAPVEDRAQEQVVVSGARAAARARGLGEAGVAVLAALDGLRCRPGARAALLRDSRRLIRTRFVTDRARAGLVDALLKVHGATPCRRAGRGC